MFLGMLEIVTGENFEEYADDRFDYFVGAFVTAMMPPQKFEILKYTLMYLRRKIKIEKKSCSCKVHSKN